MSLTVGSHKISEQPHSTAPKNTAPKNVGLMCSVPWFKCIKDAHL